MLDTELTDWRAGCGKSARPVRREGRGSIPRPYPYPAMTGRLPFGAGHQSAHWPTRTEREPSPARSGKAHAGMSNQLDPPVRG